MKESRSPVVCHGRRWTALGTLSAALLALASSRSAWAAPAADTAAARATTPTPPKGTPGNSRPSDAVSAADLTVLQKLHDANQMEIQMGHLAEAKGSTKATKDYGRQLVRDHMRADQRVADLLKLRGLDVKSLATTTNADPAHAMTAEQPPGVDFDHSFASQMVKDHQKTIDLLENARRLTGDERLKTLYEELLPTLRAHQQTAQRLAEGKGRV